MPLAPKGAAKGSPTCSRQSQVFRAPLCSAALATPSAGKHGVADAKHSPERGEAVGRRRGNMIHTASLAGLAVHRNFRTLGKIVHYRFTLAAWLWPQIPVTQTIASFLSSILSHLFKSSILAEFAGVGGEAGSEGGEPEIAGWGFQCLLQGDENARAADVAVTPQDFAGFG